MKSRFPSTSRYASAQDDIAGEGEKQVLRLRAPLRMTSWWRVKSRSFDFALRAPLRMTSWWRVKSRSFDFALRAPLRMTSWWWEARRSSFEGGSRFESGNQSSDRRLPGAEDGGFHFAEPAEHLSSDLQVECLCSPVDRSFRCRPSCRHVR